MSAFRRQVLQVIDHHPFDGDSSKLPANCVVTINEVGSCATLIADLILSQSNPGDFLDALKMLYPVIVLDTVNFSPAADKAQRLDYSIAEQLQRLLDISESSSNQMFDDLVAARVNVSSLDSLQILSKDLKTIASNRNALKMVAIPGFPILVQVLKKFHIRL